MSLTVEKSLFNSESSQTRAKSSSGNLQGHDVKKLETAPPSHVEPVAILVQEMSAICSGAIGLIIPLGILIGGIYLLSAFPVGSGGYIAGIVLTSYGAVNIAVTLCCISCAMSCIPCAGEG